MNCGRCKAGRKPKRFSVGAMLGAPGRTMSASSSNWPTRWPRGLASVKSTPPIQSARRQCVRASHFGRTIRIWASRRASLSIFQAGLVGRRFQQHQQIGGAGLLERLEAADADGHAELLQRVMEGAVADGGAGEGVMAVRACAVAEQQQEDRAAESGGADGDQHGEDARCEEG